MITKFNRSISLFKDFNATEGFRERQSTYLNSSRYSDDFYAQPARLYLNKSIHEDSIKSALEIIENYEDCMDFRMNTLLRMLYLNLDRDLLEDDLVEDICTALGNAKYWMTEDGPQTTAYYNTENHQILFHAAELLVGQLFPNDTFENSDMTGEDHIDNAEPMIIDWLDWRAQFGFNEWHSDVYYIEDIAALLNLVDFALNDEIVIKAAMILDIIAFDFANNYYKGNYASSHGRTYDRHVLSSGGSINEIAYIMFDIGDHSPCSINMGAVNLATSDHYAPPPILESLAHNITDNWESKERHNIGIDEGKKYGIDYDEDDLSLWMGMQCHIAPETVEEIIKYIEKYDLDAYYLLGPQFLIDYLKITSLLLGISVEEASERLAAVTRGIVLETANCYTYRTPDYQLSGVQDHKKGTNSIQEHIWQASLDDSAYVFTSSSGAFTHSFEQFWVGGWRPRATLYKNVGIIQYDRETTPIELEVVLFLINLFSEYKFYHHAYFPKTAFDKVQIHDGWTFGAKDDGYVALYSYEPAFWVSDYELRVNGFKNTWIVELGSEDDYDDFDDFISEILDSEINITPEDIGYDISYDSPSQGEVKVAWEGSMRIDDNKVDLGDYERFENDYCTQKFATMKTIIEFNSTSLILDFDNATRTYTN